MKQRFARLGLVALSVFAGCGVVLSHAEAKAQTGLLEAGFGKGFVSETAAVNGITLHYVRGGKGPAVILVHGFPQDWFEYHAIMPQSHAERGGSFCESLRHPGAASRSV